jgi:hypothetical protein
MKHRFTLLFLAAFAITAQAQITGGQSSFAFLRLSPSARITGMGGAQVAVRDDDVSFAALNPAALNPRMSGAISLNHNFYLADLQHGYVAYGQHLKKIGFTVHGGVQYQDYGDIPQADELGNVNGNVRAKDIAFVAGAARPLSDKWSLGLNLRWANSALDVYRANALSADVGLQWADTASRTTVGLVIRHAGTIVNTYDQQRTALPLDIQIGITRRLKHLPFRFGVMAHQLQQWNIRYDDPALVDDDEFPLSGEQNEPSRLTPVIDNFFRHLIFNGEFLLGKSENFRLRFGYNHLRRRELVVRNYGGLAGFSGGIGLKVKRFRIETGFSNYHLGGSALHVAIGTSI